MPLAKNNTDKYAIFLPTLSKRRIWKMKKSRKFGLFLGLALMLCVTWPANAALVTYTEQATGSGTFGGYGFTDVLVTVTFTGDTANIVDSSGFYNNIVGTATVNVSGFVPATFTDTMEAFDNQGAIAAGISDWTLGASVLDTYDNAFATYDLITSIGPISNSPYYRPDITFNTDRGGFNLTSLDGNSTFTATVSSVPEPATMLLLGLGLVGLAGVRRNFKQ